MSEKLLDESRASKSRTPQWLLDVIAENPPMPQTPAERQEARRARLLMEGKTEVRGVFLHPDQHAELKEYAKKLAKKRKQDRDAAR